MNESKFFLALGTVMIAVLLWLSGCGGGVGTGGTGTYTYGPITGFGSVIVGGVRFDDAQARVEDDEGAGRTRDELKLGMTVGIDSDRVATGASGSSATAVSVRFGSVLVGPIATVDAAGFVSALGLRVNLGGTTVFDDALGGASALTVGRVVEVHGLVDPTTQAITATRVDAASNPSTFKVRGVLSQLNTSTRTFSIGSAAYALGAGASLPEGAATGQVVTVRVAPIQSAGRWTVVGALVPRNSGRPDGDRSECSVRGLVTAYVSSARFTVNDLVVDAGTATFADGTAGVVNGARVKVEGRCTSTTLLASKVEIESNDRLIGEGVDLRGAIESIDRAATTLRVRGLTVFYGGAGVRFDGGTATDLTVGRQVRVRGVLAGDRSRVDAQRIEF
jgi:hypothetical protein